MLDFLNKFKSLDGDYICYNLDILKIFVQRILLDFSNNNYNILFALKANYNIHVLKLLAEMGIGADCASIQEYNLAKLANFNTISATGPKFSKEEINILVNNNIQFDFDNYNQLYEYNNTNKNIGLRISLKMYNSRFGVDIEDKDVKQIITRKQFVIRRLHFHFGNKRISTFSNFLNNIYEYIIDNNVILSDITVINLGGGFEDIYAERKEHEMIALIDDFSEKLMKILGRSIKIIVEPGSLISLPIGFMKSKVISINEKEKNITLSLSAFNFSTWHKCDPIYHNNEYIWKLKNTKFMYNLYGCSCFEQDFYGKYNFSKKVSMYDNIILFPVGAYNFNLSRNLHYMEPPLILIYKNNRFEKNELY